MYVCVCVGIDSDYKVGFVYGSIKFKLPSLNWIYSFKVKGLISVQVNMLLTLLVKCRNSHKACTHSSNLNTEQSPRDKRRMKSCYQKKNLHLSKVELGISSIRLLMQEMWFSPWVGKIPWRRKLGNPLQYSCLGNSMDRGTWLATVLGVTKSWTQLSD